MFLADNMIQDFKCKYDLGLTTLRRLQSAIPDFEQCDAMMKNGIVVKKLTSHKT